MTIISILLYILPVSGGLLIILLSSVNQGEVAGICAPEVPQILKIPFYGYFHLKKRLFIFSLSKLSKNCLLDIEKYICLFLLVYSTFSVKTEGIFHNATIFYNLMVLGVFF